MAIELNPMARIAERFGGQTALARALGRSQSTVWEWVAAGRAPSWRIPEIIDAGRRQQPPVHLQPADFFMPVDETG